MCLADMVINKLAVIDEAFRLAIEKNQDDNIAGFLQESRKSTNELINWIKYLQIAHDLKRVSSLQDLTSGHERRKETRFDLPEIYSKYILFEVRLSGIYLPATIINFSNNGLKFECPEPLQVDSEAECMLSGVRGIWKKVSVKVRIRYCEKSLNGYISGAGIVTVSDSVSFNFFNNVYDLIMDYACPE
ncbi:MAG: PilZ domain-containing protein [Nitrospirota bacterium]